MHINYFDDTEGGEIRGKKVVNRFLEVDVIWFELEKRTVEWENEVVTIKSN